MKENKYIRLAVPVYEKRLVKCEYVWLISEEDGGEEEAKRILELVKENPTAIDQLGYDEVEDLEIIESEVVDSFPQNASMFIEHYQKNK